MHKTNKDLKLDYHKIEEMHAGKLISGNIQIDPYLIPGRIDERLGLSLIFSIGSQFSSYSSLLSNYEEFKDCLYMYPKEDLHITLFDVFPAVSDFSISESQLEKYKNVFEELFSDIAPFQVSLNGILFTDMAGFVKGFDCMKLYSIRQKIRQKLKLMNLAYQERYESKIAHITFCRFNNELYNSLALKKVNDNLRETYLNTLNINSVSLVVHDCYNLKRKTNIIANIPLGDASTTKELPVHAT
ncbi:2'-5' RNA ligase family protein [Vibrio sp. WXL103]|uniref:2'-5' RNA ligase family protein n=1 Tax=Vibrio sp. WXL103 TaxID=3450710 RepID=UPI003EC8775F